jgi:tryptophan 2,3-dioxygenase
MLEKMTPWDYQHVRTALGHGSGFDSPGFRNIRESLKALVESVQQALVRADLTLEKLYLDVEANESLYSLVELLVDLDEELMIWRSVHVKVIERTIGGTVSGTQGTPVEVVRNLRDRSIMEELWDVRVNLTERADRELASDG